MLERQVRNAARRLLPEGARRRLGALAGKASEKIVRPLGGFFFDLRGGRFCADGCRFEIPKELTSRSFRSCFLLGEYEADERRLVQKFIEAGDAVLEFGGCLGVVSCVTNKLLRDRERHVVVEANPRLVPALHRNRELNNSRFHIEHCAVSSEPEVCFFLHPVYVVGGSAQRQTGMSVRVPGCSWRELDERYGPFTCLIMDVEGSELSVLEDSPDLISRYRIIIAELHEWAIGNEKIEQCRALLRQGGLRFVERAGITEVWRRSP
jgi:FkbM family methyltransferase